MKPPPIRLAFGALFWRAFLVLTILLEIGLWKRLKPLKARRRPGLRLAVMVLYSPRMIFWAFLVAALFTVVIDLYVRLIMRPLMARWYSPKGESDAFGTPLAFRLSANESILDEAPARLASGRRTMPGVLMRTNRRVWFSPHAWDVEPWSLDLADLAEVTTRPPKTQFGSLVRGVPDRLVLIDGQGKETLIVVADPQEALSWFPDHAVSTELPYEPSPLQLL